jgi:hypothetical protein
MPLVVRLDAELENGLRQLSSEEHVSQAEIVRRLIRERLVSRNARKSAYRIAEALGVIGIDRDPRRDVAKRHSKYLRQALRKTMRAKRTA